MRPKLRSLAVLLLVTSPSLAQPNPVGPAPEAAIAIPDLIPDPFTPGGPPSWVGEKRAFDEHGAFRMELFHENFHYYGWDEELSKVPAGSCWEFGPTYINYIDAIPFKNLYQIARDAPRILHGVVVARQGGFLAGTPGTLVRVRRLRELRVAEAGADFLFFLHLGEVQAGPRRICLDDPTLSPLPEVGDEIVVFARGPANDIGERVMATMMEAYLTIKAGEVYLPRRMEEKSGPFRRRKQDVVQVLERATTSGSTSSPEPARQGR